MSFKRALNRKISLCRLKRRVVWPFLFCFGWLWEDRKAVAQRFGCCPARAPCGRDTRGSARGNASACLTETRRHHCFFFVPSRSLFDVKRFRNRRGCGHFHDLCKYHGPVLFCCSFQIFSKVILCRLCMFLLLLLFLTNRRMGLSV